MKKTLLLVLFLLAWVVPASAWKHGTGVNTGSCAYPLTATIDGCVGAPTASPLTVVVPTFYSGYAQQSGQIWRTTVGNTGTGNPGYPTPHPAYNIAGYDYPVGPDASVFVTPGSDAYDRNNDPTTKGYKLKLFTANNLNLDGLCATSSACTTNGCFVQTSTNRLECLGTIPTHTATNNQCSSSMGSNCVRLNGYDFENPVSGGGTGAIYYSQAAVSTSGWSVLNSNMAPGAGGPSAPATWSQPQLFGFSGLAPNIPVTFKNNYINAKSSWADLQTGSPGNSWPGNNYQGTLMISASTTAQTASNTDCGAQAVTYSICIEYNAIVGGAPRWFSVATNSCTTSCTGTIFRFNYAEQAPGVMSKIEGWVDDGANTACGTAPCYDGVVGTCLTVTSTDYGYPVLEGASSLVVAGPNVGAASLPGNGVYYLAYQGSTKQHCNSSASNSFGLVQGTTGTLINTLIATPVTGNGPFYVNGGTHGDPIFVGFGGTGFTVPQTMSGLIAVYNTELYPANTLSVTGPITFNTTSTSTLLSATINNCSPSCTTSTTAGNTLNVTSINSSQIPGVPAMQVGMTIPGSVFQTTTFATGGTLVTGDANGGTACSPSACTGNQVSTISNISCTGTSCSATTAAAHNLVSGYKFLVSGMSPTSYNGTLTATSGTAGTTLNYTTTAFNITALTCTSGTCTATVTAASGMSVGDAFTISGMTPSGYNGSFTAATGTTGTTIVYSSAATGTITAFGQANPTITAYGTETSTDGTYAVTQTPSPTGPVTFSGSLELSAATIANLTINHNTIITNSSPLFASATTPLTSAAIVGDNHDLNLTYMDIDSNFYDATGSIACMNPLYANTPTGPGIVNNVNLLGSLSNIGQWDTASNGYACNRVSVPPYTPTWQTAQIGGGGLINNVAVAPSDGTIVASSNTYGAYLYRTSGSCAGTAAGGWGTGFAAPCWEQLFTSLSVTGWTHTNVDSLNQAALEIEACNNNTADAYMFINGYLYVTTTLTGSAASRSWSQTTLANAINGNQGGNAGNNSIGCDPNNPNVVYAGVPGSLKVSGNGLSGASATFSTVTNVGTTGSAPSLIAFDPTSTTQTCTAISGSPACTKHFFVFTDGTGVYETYNGGTSFTLTTSGPTSYPFTTGSSAHMLVDKCDNVYVSIYDTHIYKYVPNGSAGGGTWSTETPGNFNSVTAFSIDQSAASCATETIAAAGSDGFPAISTTGGSSWTGVGAVTYSSSGSQPPWFGNANLHGGVTPYFTTQSFTFDNTGDLFMASGIGMWQMPHGSISVNGNWAAATIGIENLVSTHVVSAPGNAPVVGVWDRGFWTLQDPDTFPSDYWPDKISGSSYQQINAGWAVDYATFNASGSACGSSCNFFTGWGSFNNNVPASSSDGGHTWTVWPTLPATTNIGGAIAAASTTHWLTNPGYNAPLYYTLDGGTTWTTFTVSGAVTPWINTAGYRHPFAADTVNADTYCIVDNSSNFYRSTTSTPSFTKVASSGATDGGNYNDQLKAVPGQSGHYFYSGGNLGGSVTTYHLWKSTDTCGTWVDVYTGLTDIYAFGYGAPKPGGSGYPAIYAYGQIGGVFGVYENDDGATTTTWTLVPGSTFAGNSLDFVIDVSGDMNVYGRVYIGYRSSGFEYFDTATACPSVNFTNIFPTNTVTGTTTLTSAHSGLVSVATVQYSVDGTNIGPALTGAGPYSYAWVTGGVSVGTHTLKVTATGVNCSGSFAIPVVVPNTSPPSAPTGVTATNVSATSNSLTWTNNQSPDPRPITTTYMYRSGTTPPIATLGLVSSYTDTTASPNTTYTYTVQSMDGSGYTSALSSPSNSVTTPSASSFVITAQPATDLVGYGSNVATFTGVSFGATSSGRQVCIAVNVLGANVTGVTEAGNAMTLSIADPAGSPELSIWCAADATNTSGTVVVTASGTFSLNKVQITAMQLNDSTHQGTNPAGVAAGYNASPQTQSPTINASGAALACYATQSSATVTFTGGGFTALTPQQDATNAMTLACGESYASGAQTVSIGGSWSFSFGAAVTDNVYP